MKKLIKLNLICFILALYFFSNTEAKVKDNCFSCHSDLGTEEASLFENDIHHLAGLSCSDCHGGNKESDDMDLAMNKKYGFIGVPEGDQISEICSKCHSDSVFMHKFNRNLPTNQFTSLKNSVHGQLALNGKERILQCITCHNAHGIVSVKNKKSPVYPLNVPKTCNKCHGNAVYMRSYDPEEAVDQYSKYLTSMHGILNSKGDIKTAQCASCHGSHDILPVKDVRSKVYPVNIPKTCAHCHSNNGYMKEYNIPTDQFEKYSKSPHGIALLEKQDINAPACNSCHGNHAAIPPGVTSISKVCGTCHVLNAQLFSSSPHKKAFDEMNYPECETCHGNHDIVTDENKLLGVTDGTVCSKCHSAKKNISGYETAKYMRIMVDSLKAQNEEAQKMVFEAEQKGMEIEEAKFKLKDIRQAQFEAKTEIHSFNKNKFKSVINKGFAASDFVIKEAKGAVDEYYFRRIGLGISVLIISFLMVVLFLYIKKIENK